jgi:hypothetical protein
VDLQPVAEVDKRVPGDDRSPARDPQHEVVRLPALERRLDAGRETAVGRVEMRVAGFPREQPCDIGAALARARISASVAIGSKSSSRSPSSIAYDETSCGHTLSSHSGCGACQCHTPAATSCTAGIVLRSRGSC